MEFVLIVLAILCHFEYMFMGLSILILISIVLGFVFYLYSGCFVIFFILVISALWSEDFVICHFACYCVR